MEKVVNGITYVKQRAEFNCKGCAGYTDENNLCEKLGEPACSSKFIFTSLTSFNKSGTTAEGIKYDNDKTQYSLVPPYALEAVAKNLTSGLKKYPHRNNWQLVANAEERYLDAMLRHIEEHRKGNIYDTDNADPTTTHLSAVAVNSMFLLELMLNPSLNKGKTNENRN